MGMIVRFPAPPVDRCLALASITAPAIDRIVQQHVAIVDVAVETLELTEGAFAQRLHAMRDAEGGQLLADLLVAIQYALTDLDVACRTLFLARARISAGLAKMEPSHAD